MECMRCMIDCVQGGPCGVLAAVQAFVIKQLVFSVKDKKLQ